MNASIRKTLSSYFATQPVIKAWVFGSYARNTASENSDIDILVVFDEKAKVSLLRHIQMSLELEDLLGMAVDLVTEGTLLPFAEESANRDKILVYERAS